jgi:predicted nucleic acid-binding protein
VSLLFDSSILIAHLRGDGRATQLLLSVPTSERMASVLTRTEIEGGMRSHERAEVARLFGFMTLHAVTDGIARRAGEHLRRFRQSHQGIDLVDYVIAASAEAHGARLVTLNVKHFPMFEGLQLPWPLGE